MTWKDLLWAGGILLGAGYLLYRSFFKKKGYCPGCDSQTCTSKSEKKGR